MDLSGLTNSMVTATSLSSLILVWPEKSTGYQPQTKIYGNKVSNNEKFLFDYEGEQSVTLTSEITDSYVEGNYAIQDHIALAPEIISTRGFIGELNNVVPDSASALKTAADKLASISAYSPELSISAQKAYNTAFQAYQTAAILASSAVKAWDSVSSGGSSTTTIDTAAQGTDFANSVNLTTQNKQQVAFQKFYGYRKARTLFTVQTPWAIFKNCAIQELVATQDENTKVISSFAITFKTINVANTSLTSEGDASEYQGRAFYNAAPAQDSGMSAVDYGEFSFDPTSFA